MKIIVVKKIATTIILALALASTWQVTAKEISQGQLQKIIDNDKQVILLDVRTAEEFAEGHIPNAINIPHTELNARLAELSAAKNSQVILYCRSGKRAAIAKQVLENNGFTELDHLTGDFRGWRNSNLPVNKGQ